MGLVQWILRHVLFPAPYPPFYTLESHERSLLWLPPKENSSPIPCMFFSPEGPAKYFVVWCHGNGGDLGSMSRTAETISRELQAHTLMFEYPGYGLLMDLPTLPSQDTINDHAERAYSFVHDTLKWPADRIIIYGHSIGSGSACRLASREPVGALILQSPYTSIKQVIRNKIGRFADWISIPYWDNLEKMNNVTCPVLFIHGQRDTLVPAEESQKLHDALPHGQKQLEFSLDDDHISIRDSFISENVNDFISKYFPEPTTSLPNITINPELRETPLNIRSTPSFRLIPSLINTCINLSRRKSRVSGSQGPDHEP